MHKVSSAIHTDSSKGQQSTKNSGNYRRIFKFPHKKGECVCVCVSWGCMWRASVESCAIINLNLNAKCPGKNGMQCKGKAMKRGGRGGPERV